jgi:hypothetical protein
VRDKWEVQSSISRTKNKTKYNSTVGADYSAMGFSRKTARVMVRLAS